MVGYRELLLILIMPLIIIIPGWRIVSKTGYPGVMSLLFFVPLANVIMVFFLAFATWPIEKELEAARTSRGPD